MTHKRTNGLYIELTNKNEYTCSNCGSDKTYIKIRNNRGTPVWHIHNGNRLCRKCYEKLIHAPKYRKKHNEEQKQYRLSFGGIHLSLSFILPRDRCDICGISKGQGLKIDRHHYFYCVIMPWSMTIPICSKCHAKITHEGKVRVKSTIRTCLICKKTDNYKKIPHKYENGYICNTCHIRLKYGKKNKKKSQV